MVPHLNVLELCKWQKLLLLDTRNKLPVADFSYHPPKISYGQGVIPGLSWGVGGKSPHFP